MLEKKELSIRIHELLLEICKKGYNEGRTHERNSNSPHIKQAYALSSKKMPQKFEETEIYKEIMRNKPDA